LIQYAYQLFGHVQRPSSEPSIFSGIRSISARFCASNHSTSPTSPLNMNPPPLISVWLGFRIGSAPYASKSPPLIAASA
jgi:hypothetical protein